jgi:hypothetical protein
MGDNARFEEDSQTAFGAGTVNDQTAHSQRAHSQRAHSQRAHSLAAFARQLAQPDTAVSPPTPAQLQSPFADGAPPGVVMGLRERYGMRPAAPAELALFPTHPWVIDVIKARIKRIGQPVYTDLGDTPLVVWAVESYPHSRQFRLPNGDLLHEQYNEIAWEPVPLATAVSSMATIRQERIRRQWRQTVRPSLRQQLTLPPSG